MSAENRERLAQILEAAAPETPPPYGVPFLYIAAVHIRHNPGHGIPAIKLALDGELVVGQATERILKTLARLPDDAFVGGALTSLSSALLADRKAAEQAAEAPAPEPEPDRDLPLADQVRALRAKNLSYRAIAEQLGCSVGFAHAAAQEAA
jgi:hypothetical protein